MSNGNKNFYTNESTYKIDEDKTLDSNSLREDFFLTNSSFREISSKDSSTSRSDSIERKRISEDVNNPFRTNTNTNTNTNTYYMMSYIYDIIKYLSSKSYNKYITCLPNMIIKEFIKTYKYKQHPIYFNFIIYMGVVYGCSNYLADLFKERSYLQWSNTGHLSIQKISGVGNLVINRLHGRVLIERQIVSCQDIVPEREIEEDINDDYLIRDKDSIVKLQKKYFTEGLEPKEVYKKLYRSVFSQDECSRYPQLHGVQDRIMLPSTTKCILDNIAFSQYKPQFLDNIEWSSIMQGEINYYHGLVDGKSKIITVKESDECICKIILESEYDKGILLDLEEISVFSQDKKQI